MPPALLQITELNSHKYVYSDTQNMYLQAFWLSMFQSLSFASKIMSYAVTSPRDEKWK